MKNLSEQIFDILKLAIKERGTASFVVSGGSSPVKIFNELSLTDLDWSRVIITLVDDRLVNKSHNDSNEKLVFENLMINKGSNSNFVSLCNSPQDILNINRPFDVMLLGMGEDGHFASLFPQLIKTNASYFEPSSTPEIIHTEPMGNPCHKRISMNLSMILQSNNVFLLIPNKKKLEVYEQAKNDKELPLYFLLNQKNTTINIITS
ncbi:6-phosphogluconolactonase [Gammaproteobacteria bacterium]|nr:6-phosphogluconolactonase [Gammaproteobacteria bacterium]MDA9805166.1 6-phosphogluconolactonase [Gammaproteobacteria bacterium]